MEIEKEMQEEDNKRKSEGDDHAEDCDMSGSSSASTEQPSKKRKTDDSSQGMEVELVDVDGISIDQRTMDMTKEVLSPYTKARARNMIERAWEYKRNLFKGESPSNGLKRLGRMEGAASSKDAEPQAHQASEGRCSRAIFAGGTQATQTAQ